MLLKINRVNIVNSPIPNK